MELIGFAVFMLTVASGFGWLGFSVGRALRGVETEFWKDRSDNLAEDNKTLLGEILTMRRKGYEPVEQVAEEDRVFRMDDEYDYQVEQGNKFKESIASSLGIEL